MVLAIEARAIECRSKSPYSVADAGLDPLRPVSRVRRHSMRLDAAQAQPMASGELTQRRAAGHGASVFMISANTAMPRQPPTSQIDAASVCPGSLQDATGLAASGRRGRVDQCRWLWRWDRP